MVASGSYSKWKAKARLRFKQMLNSKPMMLLWRERQAVGENFNYESNS